MIELEEPEGAVKSIRWNNDDRSVMKSYGSAGAEEWSVFSCYVEMSWDV